ncbi:hypothetical protein AcW1_005299 [Taiwanofungus camphoratus]|nr:hypothetical protein AcW2_004069 [Antrodia cinnamomea]KAI0933482.1 hypothetical protein AcV5_005618 [Antrodia cinnamomea]KAI0948719.1 hypothetical protein AcV7_009383 [Antrodia cinnamomea]KAI0956676.1 hypothetical protein AcW1_005299 [Antrodia cinnamomea]
MAGLEVLPSVTRLSRTVVRILGQNPGNYTLQGTNTYLVGEHNPYVLIDTGDGRDAYIPFLTEALKGTTGHPDKPHISDIILTHKHHDHCDGLPSVLHLLRKLWKDSHTTKDLSFQPPRIHKIPLANRDMKLQAVIDSLPPDSFAPAPSGTPVHDLYDTQIIPVTTTAPDTSLSVLQVLHTPGHTTDSLCLYYPEDRALFTADTVLGHGSAVFEDLGSYMESLRKMIDFGQTESKYGPVYPGHGPVVSDGLQQVSTYLQHRVAREDQILEVLKTPTPATCWTTWTLVSSIYQNYPRELWEGAARSVDMHLRKLETEGRVECVGGLGKETEWEFIR